MLIKIIVKSAEAKLSACLLDRVGGCSVNTLTRFYFDALLLRSNITLSITIEVISSLERHYFNYAYSWLMMG